MKIKILCAVLLGLPAIPAFSQQEYLVLPEYKSIDSIIADTTYYSEVIPNYFDNNNEFPMLKDKKIYPLIPSYRKPDDNMPVLRPKGYFHGMVIRPDPAIDFKLIIKRPYCLPHQ